MNKLFLYLLIMGGLILAVLGGWELYQISTGSRDEGNLTVIDLPKGFLIDSTLEQHLISDPEYTGVTPVSFPR
jgi:hypothetical protein